MLNTDTGTAELQDRPTSGDMSPRQQPLAGPGPVRDWWKIGLRAVAGTGAVVASFIFLTDLARSTGWPGWTAYLLPLSLDALAAAAWRIYVTAGRDRFALWCGIGTTGATLAGNAVSHLIGTGHVAPGWALVASVGAIPAVSLALVIHLTAPPRSVGPNRKLATNSASTGGLNAGGVAETTGTPPEPAKIRRVGAKTTRPAGRRTDADLLAEIRIQGLGDASADRLVAEFRLGKRRAVRLRKVLAADLAPIGSNGHGTA